MNTKLLKTITQTLLLSVIVITPFFKIDSLYFPFVSGRVYLFRVLVILAFFFWVWMQIYMNKKISINQLNLHKSVSNLLVLSLILFFLAQAFVSFFGVDPVFSFFSGISRHDGVLQYGFWVLYFLLLISVFKKERDWKTFFSVFIISAFFVSVFAWLGFPPNQEIYGNFFGNPAYFSGFLLFAIGFCLIMFEKNVFDKKILNNLFLALAGFFAVTLFFTQIRGGLIGLAGGVFLFCFLSVLFLFKQNRRMALVSGLVILIGLISVISLFSARETEIVKTNPFLSRITEVADSRETGSVRERLLLWNIALKAFQEKPIFGYGPENFALAVNKYYDHKLGETEPWFVRAHNIPLEILASGGLVLFSFYLFWLFAIFYLIFKISKNQKILSFILASIFFAYFLHGFFLFDTFSTFLGLFPFLAFVASRQTLITADEKLITADDETLITADDETLIAADNKSYALIPAGLFSLLIIYMTVLSPWRANNAAWQFFNFTEAGFYQESIPVLEKSFSAKTPYTYWPVRKETGWQFLRILQHRVNEEMSEKDIQAIQEIYNFIVPEMERFIENNPYEPQMYYVLAGTYRTGFEKLGQVDDLEKAETVLKKALNYSDLRKEYFDELSQVLLLQGKFEEGEKLLQDYVGRVDFYDYFPSLTLGHFYFDAERYEPAIEQYEKAKEKGYDFCGLRAEYSRYMFSAEQIKGYEKVVAMAKNCLEKWGPDADTYFNISIGYLNLEEKEKAREFFLKAVELNPEYKNYELFFLD